MIADAVSAYLHPHHVVFAAPLECESYGGLSPTQNVELAVAAMGPFGFSLRGSLVSLPDGRPAAIWSSIESGLIFAMTEDHASRCCFAVVTAPSEEEVLRFGAVLRRFVPVVEVSANERTSALFAA